MDKAGQSTVKIKNTTDRIDLSIVKIGNAVNN